MHLQENAFPIPDQQFMKSGEFARLCQTTKDTLRHYRDIRLLEPARLSEAGYALYSPLQLGDFLLISCLRNSGSSLEEIRSYLAQPQGLELQAIIEDRVAAIKTERKTLLAQQRFLENTLARTRALSNWETEGESWRITHLPEEHFMDMDVSELFVEETLEPEREAELAQSLAEQGFLILQPGAMGEMQGAFRVGLNALREGHPEQDFHLCSRSTKASPGTTRHTRPAGTYFQQLRCASIDELLAPETSLFDAYHQLLHDVQQLGFTPIGDLYEQELSLYTGRTSDAAYTELSIRIEDVTGKDAPRSPLPPQGSTDG